MKKYYIFALYIVTLAATIHAGVPAGYYNTLTGKSGQALKNAIHDLAIQRTVHSYGSLWTYFPQTDHMPDDPSRVWDMYSDYAYYFSSRLGNSTSGMNKEHSVPKSWWGGYNESQGYIAYTDLNHLYPSDATANSAKLHYPLGEVSRVDFDNGCSRTGSPKAGQGGGSSMVFEPDDRYKGDFARTYMYMASAYQDYQWKYTWMMGNGSWLTLNQWSIDLLLRWAREDPVSDKEKDRNDAVYRCQNNRNPFIDFPDLMEYIWGNRSGEVFTGGNDVIDGPPELISPVQDTEVYFGEVALGRSLSITVYVKGHNLTNNLSVTIYRDDAPMFKAAVSSIDRSTACSNQGYPLTITYTPTELGSHKARLLISDGGLTGSFGMGLNATCLAVPNLRAVTALPAQDITDSGYVASWQPTGDEVDYFVVNRTIYDRQGAIVDSESFSTDDGEQTTLQFTDRNPEHTHTYTVQSYRLGYLSPESNVITIDNSGITGVEADRPLALLACDGGVLVKCSEPLSDVIVYTPSGQVVRRLDVVLNDDIISLPPGVYLLTARNSRRAYKIVVF